MLTYTSLGDGSTAAVQSGDSTKIVSKIVYTKAEAIEVLRQLTEVQKAAMSCAETDSLSSNCLQNVETIYQRESEPLAKLVGISFYSRQFTQSTTISQIKSALSTAIAKLNNALTYSLVVNGTARDNFLYPNYNVYRQLDAITDAKNGQIAYVEQNGRKADFYKKNSLGVWERYYPFYRQSWFMFGVPAVAVAAIIGVIAYKRGKRG